MIQTKTKVKEFFVNAWHRFHILSIDWILLALLLSAAFFSYYILTSASPERLNSRVAQLITGFAALAFFTFFPTKYLKSLSIYAYIMIIVLLVLTSIFGIVVNGSRRWLHLVVFNIQASEFAKLTLPLFVAAYVSKKSYPLNIIQTIVVLGIIAIPTILIFKQPDLGTSILVAISALVILFLVVKFTFKLISFSIIGFIGFAFLAWNFIIKDYQKTRILSILNPDRDPLGSGYHVIQSKIAIGSGGLEGKGLHHGSQVQFNFLPEKHTDFIFAVIGEELGFIGVMILLSLFILILFRVAIVIQNTPDLFSKIIATSFAFSFFTYIFVNIGMVSGLLPVVGVPLPLISYGGSSYLMLMISFGIIMSIHRQTKNSKY